MGPHQRRFPERYVPEQLAESSRSSSGASSSSSSLGEGTSFLLCCSVDEHRTARSRWRQRTPESRAKVVTLAGTRLSRRTSTFPVMLRVASTDSLCAYEARRSAYESSLLPDNRVLLNDWRAFLDVHLGPPFFNGYETSVLLERRDERLVFVGHFLIQFRRAIAGRFGQEIPNRSGASVFFRHASALSAAPHCRLFLLLTTGHGMLPGGLGLGCAPRFRFPAIRRPLLRCCCGSQFPAPFTRKVWRPACIEAREPPQPLPRARYASSRDPAVEIDYFFASSMSTLDCSNPLSFSPTIWCSPYSATSSPLGTLSDRSVCRRRTLYCATSRSVNSALLWTRWTSLTRS